MRGGDFAPEFRRSCACTQHVQGNGALRVNRCWPKAAGADNGDCERCSAMFTGAAPRACCAPWCGSAARLFAAQHGCYGDPLRRPSKFLR